MGENNDLYFEKVLLKNTDEDIPINVDLSNTPEKSSVSTIRTWKSELKNEMLLELQHRFPNTFKSLSKVSTIKSPLLKAK